MYDSCRLIEEEEVEVLPEKLPDATIDDNIDVYLIRNKTLGRAQDPHANVAWLSKLTE